jgi:general secretion pathway protein I
LKLSLVPPPEVAKATNGFTVIEVLIALALVSVTLTAIGSLIGTTTRGTRSVEQHVALVETARSIVSSFPLSGELVRSDLAGETYGHRWQIEVLPYLGGGIATIGNSPWIPRIVKIRVQSPSGAIADLETVRMQRRPKE